MHFSFSTIAAAALAFATIGDCHLIMKTPVPFGVSTLNNSPLNDAKPGQSGSDYPCKQRAGVYDITKMNHIAVDTPTEMSFIGSASHGGGTCQIAMTSDKEPTANSTFKIIQVFEGGCPIDSDGNGETHPFSFTIPKEFPNGVFTLTWLWYNRIGNREAYMNCAPVTVTGGSSSGQDYFDSLPNMYLINLPTSECQSTQDFASNSVQIPHPGQFFMQEPAGQSIAPASGPSCAASAAAQTNGVNGYKASPIITTNGAAYSAPGGAAAAPSAPPSGGSSAAAGGSSAMAGGSSAAAGGYSGSPSSAAAAPFSAAGGSSGLVTMSVAPSGAASSAAAGSAPAASAPAGSAPASSAAGGSYPSMAPSSGAGIAGPSSAAASAAPSQAAGGSAAPSAAPSSGASNGGSCSSSGVSCSDDGKKFGLCANGEIVWQAVAAGTTCKGGQIVKRSEIRNVHARRHAQSGGKH